MKFDPRQPFDLPLLPPEVNSKHEDFFDVMLKTRTELGELNGYSYSLPNPLLLLSPAVIKESVASSNIENINTTMEEALQAQLFQVFIDHFFALKSDFSRFRLQQKSQDLEKSGFSRPIGTKQSQYFTFLNLQGYVI